jgi:hypothetical protein
MSTNKIRTTLLTLIATAGFTGAAIAPAASQAQYNNFGFLKSAEGYKLKTQGGYMPCQPLNPVESPGLPSGPLPVGGAPVTKAGASAVSNAQLETKSTLSPLETQTCDADNGTEVAY